jgi:hypothetical protein
MFPIKYDLKQGDALSLLLLNFVLEYVFRRVQVEQGGLKLKVHISSWFMLIILIYWAETYILLRKNSFFVSRY